MTATIVPDYASNKAVDWSVSWVNANSAFASGKTVTDYVTVTPTSDGALTANVVCKQAFGEQIQIIVTSRDNSNVTAVCLLDYAKRITGVSFTLIGDSGKVGTISSSTTSIKVTDYTDLTLFLNPIYEYSVYTLDSDFTRETDLNYSTGVYTALSNAGLSLKTLSGTVAHSNQSQGRINWSFSCYTFGTMALTDSISSNIENDIVYGENEYPTLVNKFVSAQKNYGDTWGVLKMSVTSSVTGRVYERTLTIKGDVSVLRYKVEDIAVDNSNLVL